MHNTLAIFLPSSAGGAGFVRPEWKVWSRLCHPSRTKGLDREIVVYEELICVQSVFLVVEREVM